MYHFQKYMGEFSAIEQRSDKVKFMSKFHNDFKLSNPTLPLKISKNDKKSEELRALGNQFYSKHELVEAAEMYNKSLCFAESSLNLALGYANRSAVCFELKMYSNCLKNIELAKKHNYPADKMSKLGERAEKCRRMIEEGAESDEDLMKPAGVEYLKLTRPPHPKLPYIADCLNVKYNDEFGRHVITNKKLLPGEIVCIEAPFAQLIGDSHVYKYCYHCMDYNLFDLSPCRSVTSAMFCSKKCKDEAYESYYKYEVDIIDELNRICSDAYRSVIKAVKVFFNALTACDGSLEKLKEIAEENENNQEQTIFNCGNPNDPINVFKAVDSLLVQEEKRPTHMKFVLCGKVAEMVNLFLRHTKITALLQTESDKDFFRSFLLKHTQIMMVNNHAFGFAELQNHEIRNQNINGSRTAGAGIFPFLSLINHSCDSNVTRVSNSSYNYLIVVKVVEPNEQLFDCYGCGFIVADLATRQSNVHQSYMFDCKCEACEKNFPLMKDLPLKITDGKTRAKLNDMSKIVEQRRPIDVKKLFEMCCKLLIKTKKNHPCRETVGIKINMLHSFRLLLMPKLFCKLKFEELPLFS